MSGQEDLKTIIQSLKPRLRPGSFVFCTIPGGVYGDYSTCAPVASMLEEEGLTLVLTQASAKEANLSYDGVFSCITLGVHSSLLAVGLTAALAGALTQSGITANVIAGYFHDHVFVPENVADLAMTTLESLSKGAREASQRRD